MNKFTIFCIFFWANICVFSQTADSLQTDDSSIQIIELEEVILFGKDPVFENSEARKKYNLLRYRVEKVYPYAKLAAQELFKIQKSLDTISGNRAKKRYTKKIQQQIEQRFTDELTKLSRSQGRILIKLIYRQTGRSAFDLVKELRSGWRAFWYNNTAWLYDLSLKSVYDPTAVEEDFWIEDVLQRAFSGGRLEPQPPAIHIDYQSLEKKWRQAPVFK